MRRVLRRVGYLLAKTLGLLSAGAVQNDARDLGGPSTVVGEITPCDARPAHFQGRRLNLLLPSINARHYFGGIHTAVQLYTALARHFPSSRIVLMDSAPDEAALNRFGDHRFTAASADSDASKQIVAFSDRYGQTLPVAAGDVWLTTAWWTTYAGQRLASWQKQAFEMEGRLINLIQDFEPGFYPWSSQSALALGTYRPDKDIGVFNTRLLADYFEHQGLGYKSRLVFEPVINDGLRDRLLNMRRTATNRQRRIVVYARPSTPRNAFELLCEALRKWGWSDPACKNWEIVAAGELTADIDLGPVKLVALGKLDISAYAELLATSAIGVSIMVSPHPSYPPLEMAAFGMSVITNKFANKDLSDFSSNIHSFTEFSPESIAQAIASQVAAWEGRQMLPSQILSEDHAFLAAEHLQDIASELSRLTTERDTDALRMN
jgi:hypothetical protein